MFRHSLALAALVSGCSVLIEPDQDRLGGGIDAGREVDAAACTGDPRCEGETFVDCVAGIQRELRCDARMAYCTSGGCVAWACEPGEHRCALDPRATEVCTARGDGFEEQPCEIACDVATGSCIGVDPECEGLPGIAVGGTQSFDLCAEQNDDSYLPQKGCEADLSAGLGDRTFVVTLRREATLEIELTDVDPDREVDTVVYVRTACDDGSSQLACDDDVRCFESTVPESECNGDWENRQSRIEVTLEPGTYYIVADAFASPGHDCGRVRLAVRNIS
jgi:hypothetical protein